MLIDISEEKILPSLRDSLPYILTLTEEFIVQHRNPIHTLWLFDGPRHQNVITQMLEQRKDFANDVERCARHRKLLMARDFCLVTIYLQHEDDETINNQSNCVAVLAHSIQEWADVNNEMCVVAAHMEQNETVSGRPTIPHMHAIYRMQADMPDRMSNWINHTVLS